VNRWPPLVIVFVAALFVCAILTKTHTVSWNDGSRFATVESLVDRHTAAIDGSPFLKIIGDWYRYHGKTYSDKPPLLAVSGAAIGFVLAPFGITFERHRALTIYLVTLLTVGAWYATGCCYVYLFGRLLGFIRMRAYGIAALSGLATLSLPYATVLSNHVPCGVAAIAGFYHAERAKTSGSHAALAGLFFALSYCFDPTAVIFVVPAAVLMMGTALHRWIIMLAAGLPIVAAQLGFNVLVTGSVIPPALNKSLWLDPTLPLYSAAWAAFTPPTPIEHVQNFFNLLVGSKGLFLYTPLALVCVYGLVLMFRSGGFSRRLAAAITLSAVTLFVLMLFFQNDATARNFGERRYVDVFWLLCIALGPALAQVRSPAQRLSIALLIAASILVAMLGVIAPFGGTAGEPGFVFAAAAFSELARRSWLQATLDIAFAFAAIAVTLRLLRFEKASVAAYQGDSS
jgi:hypothetical protein